MNHNILILADWFFLFFHTVFTLFNIFGWISRKTRKIHLITMGLTTFSWFFLGIWYGIGFCFCTQWHWQVRSLLGTPIKSHSYIHFLFLELTGVNLNPSFVDQTVMIIFIITIIMTIFMNIRDYLKSKRNGNH
ncbi:MAG: DUF2784 domain-containing protein [Spirochaetaceae bacterium]|jgi:hypothetical protein|nr:DUF2784 domain-containing protein [Spirochaetaceae bacterium]